MSERKINSSAGSVGGFQCQRLRRSRIADLYDNEKEISSDSNSFNLDGIQQNIEGEKWTASVERLEGNGYRMVLQSPGNHRSRVLL